MAARPTGRRSSRMKVWRNFSVGAFAQSAGSVAVMAFASEQLREKTLIRIRGNIVTWVDGVAAPATAAIVTLGLIVVPEGTGTTVLQAPFTDSQRPWIWYESFMVGYEEMVTDVIDIPALTSFRAVIDSKSMRKVPPDSELQMVFENTTSNGAETVNTCVEGRVLFAY